MQRGILDEILQCTFWSPLDYREWRVKNTKNLRPSGDLILRNTHMVMLKHNITLARTSWIVLMIG